MKKPSFQFYPGDWKKDPAVRKCKLATRGVWIELILAIYELGTGSISGTAEQLGQIASCSAFEIEEALVDLEATGAAIVRRESVTQSVTQALRERYAVTDCHNEITVTCRRIENEVKTKSANALRQQRFREKRKSNEKITPLSSSSTSVTLNSNEFSVVTPAPVTEKKLTLPTDPLGLDATELFGTVFGTKLTLAQKKEVAARVTDLPRWQQALQFWQLNAYKPSSVGRLLDYYDELKNNNGKTNQQQHKKSNTDQIREQSDAIDAIRGLDPIAQFAIDD